MDQNIKSDITEDGILIARIDMPGRTMNVFSLDMMDSLERLLDHVEGNASVRAVVLTSGKQAFLAGADLDMIRMFTERARTDSHEQLHALCGRLGRLFRRLERSPKPYVVAINGLALGGGLEVSLACHARIAADDKSVQLGLPEIKLGLLPGAGGTQRLPRMIGTRPGLQMLLSGEPLTPHQALECGVVDELAPPDELLDAALRLARSLDNRTAPWDKPGVSFPCAPFDFTQADAQQQIAEALGLGDELLARYPAYRTIMDCVIGGWNKPMDEACHWEMDNFVRLIQDPVAGNMVRTLFLNRQRAAKLAPVSLDPRTTRVAVIGDGAESVQAMLAAGKATLVAPAELGERDIAVLMPGAQSGQGIRVAWLGEAKSFEGASAAVWLSEATAQGRALEVVVPHPDSLALDAGILLGRWLRATALPTSGKTSLLASLQASQAQARQVGCSEADELLAVALAAQKAWGEGGIDDVDLADVAAVIAGLHPAYSGGPFNYLRQLGLENLSSRVAAASAEYRQLFAVPEFLPALLDRMLKKA
ncbi:MAG: enoyl-CoA hydratase/isomerase family protein [Proteobacteria bacterium]|nr:enoyl-CoA hydratase/isomerase family protein [Pseudomonadota bacterium]